MLCFYFKQRAGHLFAGTNYWRVPMRKRNVKNFLDECYFGKPLSKPIEVGNALTLAQRSGVTLWFWLSTVDRKTCFKVLLGFQGVHGMLRNDFRTSLENQKFKIFDEFTMVFAILVSDRGFVIEWYLCARMAQGSCGDLAAHAPPGFRGSLQTPGEHA